LSILESSGLSVRRRLDNTPDFLDCGNGLNRPGANLASAGALRGIPEPALKELGVGENHAQLVVQSMEHPRQISLNPRLG